MDKIYSYKEYTYTICRGGYTVYKKGKVIAYCLSHYDLYHPKATKRQILKQMKIGAKKLIEKDILKNK